MNSDSVDKITSHCLATGTEPFFGLFRLPEELDDVKNSLVDEVKKSGDRFDIEKYAHLPSQPELWFIIETLKKSIEEKYVESFLEFDRFIESFSDNFPELADEVERTGRDRGLLSVGEEFLPDRGYPFVQWLEFKGNAFFISRSLPGASNGTLELSESLLFLIKNPKIKLKIRPDCFRKQPVSDVFPRSELAHWYGRPFNLEWVRELRGEEPAEHGPDNSFLDGHCTQFLWSSKKDATVQLSMEELPHKAEGNLEQADKRIFTRFVHAIFDPAKEIFTHLDGAVRIYDKPDYEDRICCQNLKNCNKSYYKAKIFRVDGEIDYEVFRHVVGAFYKWNRMPIEYFENSA